MMLDDPIEEARMQELSELDIFSRNNKYSVDLIGTTYSHWPYSQKYDSNWFEYFSYNRFMLGQTRRGYVPIPLDEILEKIPDDIKKVLLFNLDLVV